MLVAARFKGSFLPRVLASPNRARKQFCVHLTPYFAPIFHLQPVCFCKPAERHSFGIQEEAPRGMLLAMARRQAKMGIAPSQFELQSSQPSGGSSHSGIKEETPGGLKGQKGSAELEQASRNFPEHNPQSPAAGGADGKEPTGEGAPRRNAGGEMAFAAEGTRRVGVADVQGEWFLLHNPHVPGVRLFTAGTKNHCTSYGSLHSKVVAFVDLSSFFQLHILGFLISSYLQP